MYACTRDEPQKIISVISEQRRSRTSSSCIEISRGDVEKTGRNGPARNNPAGSAKGEISASRKILVKVFLSLA